MIDYRFQNKGLGKKAFKNILKYLKNCGISAVKSKRIKYCYDLSLRRFCRKDITVSLLSVKQKHNTDVLCIRVVLFVTAKYVSQLIAPAAARHLNKIQFRLNRPAPHFQYLQVNRQ